MFGTKGIVGPNGASLPKKPRKQPPKPEPRTALLLQVTREEAEDLRRACESLRRATRCPSASLEACLTAMARVLLGTLDEAGDKPHGA